MLFRSVTGKHEMTKRGPLQQCLEWCCQSNRNSSPTDGALALGARAERMIACHPASAAERYSLPFGGDGLGNGKAKTAAYPGYGR